MCGGAPEFDFRRQTCWGLSPHVRGSLRHPDGYGVRVGSIPACAGEPATSDGNREPSGVYPRMCGGAHPAVGVGPGRQGLSPHVRGSHCAMRPEVMIKGSIPACAGEPAAMRPEVMITRVYPRMCGGAPYSAAGGLLVEGLSPHVRGSRRRICSDEHIYGSIPACAGEPRTGLPCQPLPWVYPRMCGGAEIHDEKKLMIEGLSPHVRGSHELALVMNLPSGSIPACAGEPVAGCTSPSPTRVYPRMCGGADASDIATMAALGLSPHVRGSPAGDVHDPLPAGSIPACAGEPPGRPLQGRRFGVYPRMCGGAEFVTHHIDCVRGLSPHVRGSLVSLLLSLVLSGSIPACAGEPC